MRSRHGGVRPLLPCQSPATIGDRLRELHSQGGINYIACPDRVCCRFQKVVQSPFYFTPMRITSSGLIHRISSRNQKVIFQRLHICSIANVSIDTQRCLPLSSQRGKEAGTFCIRAVCRVISPQGRVVALPIYQRYLTTGNPSGESPDSSLENVRCQSGRSAKVELAHDFTTHRGGWSNWVKAAL